MFFILSTICNAVLCPRILGFCSLHSRASFFEGALFALRFDLKYCLTTWVSCKVHGLFFVRVGVLVGEGFLSRWVFTGWRIGEGSTDRGWGDVVGLASSDWDWWNVVGTSSSDWDWKGLVGEDPTGRWSSEGVHLWIWVHDTSSVKREVLKVQIYLSKHKEIRTIFLL